MNEHCCFRRLMNRRTFKKLIWFVYVYIWACENWRKNNQTFYALHLIRLRFQSNHVCEIIKAYFTWYNLTWHFNYVNNKDRNERRDMDVFIKVHSGTYWIFEWKYTNTQTQVYRGTLPCYIVKEYSKKWRRHLNVKNSKN